MNPPRANSTAGLGILYAMKIASGRLFFRRFEQIEGWTAVVMAVLVLGGLQMMLIGVIGEYVGRIFEETKGRPQFIVERLIGFEAQKPEDPGLDP